MNGKVYGVGVGPGDPELVTLKAHRLILAADVIAYPAPDSGDSFARRIVATYMPAGCVEIPMVVPMRVERYPAQDVYDEGAAQILAAAQAGKNVVVLCEGDPFFYGSFMYLFGRLSGAVDIEVVPGVSSLCAVTAAARTPLCAREETLSVVPATLPEDELVERLNRANAVAMMKIGRHFAKAKRAIAAAGLTDRVWTVHDLLDLLDPESSLHTK